MRTKLKRILSAALACVMLLALLPATALAVDSGNDSIVSTGENGVEINKMATPNGDGTYRIEMDAYVKGSVQAASGTPLDIVLVLDQSGSMAYGKNDSLPGKGETSRTAQLKAAVNSFVTSISENAKKYNVDHRIAIVGYASDKDTGPTNKTDTTNYPINGSTTTWVNTGLYVNGVFKNYGDTDTTSYTYEEVYNPSPRDSETDYFVLVDDEYVKISYDWIYKSSWYYTTGWHMTYIEPKTSEDDSDTSHVQVYTLSSSTVTTPGLTAADYQAALVSVNTDNSVTSSITTAINSLAASGGTYTEYGLEMAKKVFDNNAAENGRQRIVVLFTDGETDSNINTVLTSANALKGSGYNAAIYTVGFYTTNNAATFLDYISSNYITASYSNKKYSGTKSEGTIDYSQTSNGDLTTVFKNIAESIQPSVTVDSSSILTDTVSTYFVPSGITPDGDGKITNGVTVYKVPAAGNGITPTWGEKIDITNQVTVTLSDKTINVTGFDYSADENLVVQKSGTWQGNKLVLAFNITTDTSYTGWQKGTNNYPTNDTASSKAGLTYGIGSTLLSASPKAPVTAYSVTYNGNGSTSGTVPTSDTYYLAGTDVAVSGNTGNLTKTGYTFSGWNTKADGTGTDYATGSTIPSISSDVDLYAKWQIDEDQTKNLSATVDYKLGDVVQTKDHIALTATVQVLQPDTLSTTGVSEKSYVGWKLSSITINGEVVTSLPSTVNNGDAVVYNYVIDEDQTKNLSATVDYKLGDVVQTKDHIALTATVQVLQPDTLSTTGVSEKSYVGWKLSSITINGEVVASLPATVNNGDAVVYNYIEKNTSVDVTKVVTSVVNPAGEPYDTKGTAKVGDTITWTITVKNKGNVPQTLTLTDILSNEQSVTIKDATDKAVTAPATITLGVDETLTYTATYTVQIGDSGDTLVNTAILKDGDTPKDEDTAPGVKIDPAVTVDKTVDKTTASVGDKLTYTITVTSNASDTLENIVVTDELLGMTGDKAITIASLPAGETWSQTYTYTVKSSDAGKKLVNTAIASTEDGKELDRDSTDGTSIRVPSKPTKPSQPALNTEDHVAYIIGYDDGTVKPTNNITRAEVATIFFRLLTDDSRAEFWSQTNSYSDVSSNNWFNNAVSTLSNAGIISGYPDGTFKPNAPITRAEFAAIATRFSDASYTGRCTFTDVPADHWAANAIALAQDLGWINGYSDGTFKPNQPITRAEAMTLINRVLERAVDRDHMLADMVTWTDNRPGSWYYEAVQEATNSHEYTRTGVYVPSQSFCYENWVKILEAPDWAALENAWSTANSQ